MIRLFLGPDANNSYKGEENMWGNIYYILIIGFFVSLGFTFFLVEQDSKINPEGPFRISSKISILFSLFFTTAIVLTSAVFLFTLHPTYTKISQSVAKVIF